MFDKLETKLNFFNLTAGYRKRDGLPWDLSDCSYSGVGGNEYFNTEGSTDNTPIVFVHGNTRSSRDWDEHIEYLIDNGYVGDDIWAITFDKPTSSHEEMAEQLESFILNVLEITGENNVSIVSHSLGVTGSRYWMYSKNRYDVVDSFLGIAGPNHGMEVSRRLSIMNATYGVARPADFIRSDYERIQGHPLSKMNNTEPVESVDYYTIRGSKDTLYQDKTSPVIEGGTNIELDKGHDACKDADATKKQILKSL